MPRKILATVLSGLLVCLNTPPVLAQTTSQEQLEELVNEPYLELLERVDQLKFSKSKLDDFRKQLEREEKAEKERLKGEVHCQILKFEEELRGKEAERKNGLPVAYDNKLAKVDLIEKWPIEKDKIEQVLASGRARERRFGDVEDIGIRVLKEGQGKDIKVGEEAIRDMES